MIPPEWNEAQLYASAAVHLSVAEDAIRRATGMPGPPKECWGCTDTQFHATRFHLFRECPNRADPAVRENFAKRLGLFRQTRQNSTYGPSANLASASNPLDPSTWEANGWPNLTCALLVTEITRPDLSPALRRVILPSLVAAINHTTDRPNKRAAIHLATTTTDTNPEEKDHSYYGPGSATTYYTLMITAPPTTAALINSLFSYTPTASPRPPIMAFHLQPTSPTDRLGHPTTPIALSQVLPHICFPIGPRTDHQGTLRCMVDTGASLNVGRTDYHSAIARNRPDLVHHFGLLKDTGMQPFGIGSVDGNGAATMIDSIITYKTPYVIRGQPVTVTFALGSSIATNSILSFPFFQSIKASFLFENMTCISSLLGDSFKFDLMVPLRADNAPTIPADAPAAYTAEPAPLESDSRFLDIYLCEAGPNRL